MLKAALMKTNNFLKYLSGKFEIVIDYELEVVLKTSADNLANFVMKDIVRIKNSTDPAGELATFKEIITVFLDNKMLEDEDPIWEELLPERLVKFTNQLDNNDYHKDDLITHIPNTIHRLQDIRDWEWYSSKLIADGFEVIMSGMFRYIFRPILHHLGIPQKSIFVEREGVEYPTKSVIDVLTYKTFDPVTFELK